MLDAFRPRPTRYTRAKRPARPYRSHVSGNLTGRADLNALTAELASLRAENARLLRLLKLTQREAAPPGPAQAGLFEAPPGAVHAGSPPEAKVAFFGALFAARTDIYAVRWENARTRAEGVASRSPWRVAQGRPARRA